MKNAQSICIATLLTAATLAHGADTAEPTATSASAAKTAEQSKITEHRGVVHRAGPRNTIVIRDRSADDSKLSPLATGEEN